MNHIAPIDIDGLPAAGHWHVAHLRAKKLSSATLAFTDFLIDQGGALMDS